MKLKSSAFSDKDIIPSRYTCEGANISPPIEIEGIPSQCKSLVLIMEDPDVPTSVRADRIWDHWIVFNLPPHITHLEEGKRISSASYGQTTFGHNRYGGPCPPDREHRYYIRMFALDAVLSLKEGATKQAIQKAMEGHVLQKAEIMGRYEKGKGY